MNIPISKIKHPINSKKSEQKHDNVSDTKAKKILNLTSKICFSVLLLTELLVCGTLIYLSVLPLKYLAIILVVAVIIVATLGFFTFKKSFGKVAKSICIACDAILSAAFIIVFFYLSYTMGFMSSIFASGYQIEEYQLVVKKDSVFNSIEDLNHHTVATYDDNSDNYKKALEQISEKITLTATDAGSVLNAVTIFLDDTVDSLLIKSSLIGAVSDINPQFSTEDIRVIDTITFKTKIDSTENTNINVTKDSFNIFISGIDTYGEISTVSRSDVNMIVTINPRAHTILLTSIPRDFYVQLHGTTGLRDKLTHAGLYGINMSIGTLEDLFGIKINYYVRVNFDSTISLINAIDGIDITPDVTFSRYINGAYCYYEEGVVNHLDGLCALRYARERKAYGLGDLHRIQNQQEVIMAIINKLTGSKILLAKYTDILSSMSGTLETNIPSSQIYKLINEQLDSMPSWKIERISVTGEHIDAPTYTFPDQNLFVFEPDMDSVTKATEKINEVMSRN